MKITGNTILITGGTSGIGHGSAGTFYERGNQVIVTGRRQASLDEVTAGHPGMVGLLLDLADPASLQSGCPGAQSWWRLRESKEVI